MTEYLEKLVDCIVNPKHGQLSTIYNKWRNSPEIYEKEMTETIDKIIYTVLGKNSLRPVYRRFEDESDLLQDLRLLCFQRLNKLKNDENKSIYNYLGISSNFALKDKARKVGKRLDREQKEAEILGEKKKQSPTLFYFNDILLESVATMLASGETKQDICNKLDISRTKLKKEIEKLKVIYGNKK